LAQPSATQRATAMSQVASQELGESWMATGLRCQDTRLPDAMLTWVCSQVRRDEDRYSGICSILLRSTLCEYSAEGTASSMLTVDPTEAGSLEMTLTPRMTSGTALWQLDMQDTSRSDCSVISGSQSLGSSIASEQHSWEERDISAETIAPCGSLDGGLISVLRRLGETDLSTTYDFEESPAGLRNGRTERTAWQETLRQLRDRYTERTPFDETWTPAGGLDGGLLSVLRRLGEEDFGETFSATGADVRRLQQLSTVLLGERLSEEEISSLPKVRFERAEEQCCSICLEPYKQGELLTQLPCQHFFHVDCIAGWMNQATNCPLCRGNCAH